MAKILLKTTIPTRQDDWHAGRFSLLTTELRSAGHDVVPSDRVEDATGNDPDLLGLPESDYDQLWLIAVDVDDALSDDDVAAICAFRSRNGGLYLTRDHQDMGSCITRLGLPGRAHHFQNVNPETDEARRCRDDAATTAVDWPNYHSGANGDVQKIEIVDATHPVVQRSDGTLIEYLPSHPHEGVVSPTALPAKLLICGRSNETGNDFGILVAIEGEQSDSGDWLGRALAESTFHHIADYNWDPRKGCPSFVEEPAGCAVIDDPSRLDDVKQLVRNYAAWLSAAT